MVGPKDFVTAAVRAVRRMLREYFTGTAAELAYYGLVILVITAGLYRLVPKDARPEGILSVGSVTAVVVWVVSSGGFEVWVGSIADYDATYGALAGAVAFAIWLWISNLALLFGMVLDLELRADHEGVPRTAAARLDT